MNGLVHSSSPPGVLAAWIAANETAIICAFAALLFIVNLATAELYPTSWMDECMFSDPAINLAHGRGFTSTVWWEPADQIWSGNVPLYSVLLAPWVKLAGASRVAVRTFNYVTICFALVIFWLAIKRLNWIPLPTARVLMIVIAFISYPFCFVYRTARPDCVGILLCAIGLLACSFENKRARNIILFTVGLLLPGSGLQLIAFTGFLCVLSVILAGRKWLPLFGFLFAGIIVGGIALFSFYHANHLTGIQDTIKHTREFHQMAAFSKEKGSRLITSARRAIADELRPIDALPPLILLVVLGASRVVWSDRKMRSLVLLGAVASFALVIALEFGLHYLEYYHWMNQSILLIPAFAVLAAKWNLLGGCRKALVTLVLAGLILSGLPLRIVLGLATGNARQAAQFQTLIDNALQTNDVVFIDYPAYFPVKAKAMTVYSPAYNYVITPGEKKQINVLVLGTANFEGYFKAYATNAADWKEVGRLAPEYGPLGQWVTRHIPSYTRQATTCGYGCVIVRQQQ